jgi:uncharacterized protein YukE
VQVMRVTDQGFYPYPRSADSTPLNRLANDLKQLCDGLTNAAGQINVGTRATQQTWTGAAAEAFAAHATKRSTELTEAAQVLSKAVPALQTFARAIDTTQTAYVLAVQAERIARAMTPYGEAAVAKAIGLQKVAIGAHQTAGLTCGGALAVVNGLLYFELADDAQPSLGETMPPPTAPAVAPTPTALPTVDTTTMPNTAAMTETQRYDTYREFLRSRGVNLDQLPANQRVILGLRVPTETTSNNGTGRFADRIVVMWSEQQQGVNGALPTTVRRVAEFNAAVSPGAQNDTTPRGTTPSPRSVRDLGGLPAGEYVYQRDRQSIDEPAPRRATQTFEGRAEWNRFWNALGDRRNQTDFRYVITEVNPPRR